MDLNFSDFLLLEQRQYLGQKVGDILTAVHDLRDEAKSMGSRGLVKYSEKVVNQIRRILHQHWPREERKHLKVLQKVAVALMKAIEENDDLESVVGSAASELERLSTKLGVPIHQLGTPDKRSGEKDGTEDMGVSPPEEGNPPATPPPSSPQPPGAGLAPGADAQPPGGPPAGAGAAGVPPPPGAL